MPYSALINVSNVTGIQTERRGDRGSLGKVDFLFFFKVWFMFHSVIKKSSPAVVWPEIKVCSLRFLGHCSAIFLIPVLSFPAGFFAFQSLNP